MLWKFLENFFTDFVIIKFLTYNNFQNQLRNWKSFEIETKKFPEDFFSPFFINPIIRFIPFDKNSIRTKKESDETENFLFLFKISQQFKRLRSRHSFSFAFNWILCIVYCLQSQHKRGSSRDWPPVQTMTIFFSIMSMGGK